MTPTLQAKVLRVLQDNTFERVGGNVSITVDVRIIAATNRNLEQMIQENTFRADLYYRINVMPVHVPPLRNRRDDIRPLSEHFLHLFSKKHGKRVFGFSEQSMDQLLDYSWPGNVRELMNVIERAVILTDGDTIRQGVLLLPHTAHTAPATTLNLKELERHAIKTALEHTEGNRRKAAEVLGISLRTLQYKIKEYGFLE